MGYSGYSFTRGLLFGAGQIRRATFYDIASGALAVLGVGLGLLLGIRGVYALSPLAVAYLIFAAANWPYSRAVVPRDPLRREMDSFVLLGVLGTVMSAGFLQVSMLIARATDVPVAAGYYAAAMSLATPLSMMTTSISLVLFPAMAAAWGRGDEAYSLKQADIATRGIAALVVPLFGAAILCNEMVVLLVWGSEFERTAKLLPIMLAAVCANALGVVSICSLNTRSQRGMKLTTFSTFCGLA